MNDLDIARAHRDARRRAWVLQTERERDLDRLIDHTPSSKQYGEETVLAEDAEHAIRQAFELGMTTGRELGRNRA